MSKRYNPNCIKSKIQMNGLYRIVWERGKNVSPIILQQNIPTKEIAAKRKLEYSQELGIPSR